MLTKLIQSKYYVTQIGQAYYLTQTYRVLFWNWQDNYYTSGAEWYLLYPKGSNYTRVKPWRAAHLTRLVGAWKAAQNG